MISLIIIRCANYYLSHFHVYFLFLPRDAFVRTNRRIRRAIGMMLVRVCVSV